MENYLETLTKTRIMNKTVLINLGGAPFTIDDDAFFVLENYLKNLESFFSESEGCDEIVSDIEIRFSELLNERLKTKSIVDKNDVDEVIAVLGVPEQFESENSSAQKNVPKDERQYAKRLYRDVDNKMISGVAAGIAAYLGIDDPIWIRLVFVLSVMTGGIGIPAYFILIFLMPKAITPLEKMEMRGERINVQSIARAVESQIHDISDTLSNLSKNYKRR